MAMPFTIEDFFGVFGKYNLSVWPLQIALYLVAGLLIVFIIRKQTYTDRLVSASLGLLWLWMGIVYHMIYFAPINRPAYLFGVIYIVQAFLFIIYGVLRNELSYRFSRDISGLWGGILILYALVIYPIMGSFFGHVYPEAPIFGVPCPTTIFTFGILLWTDKKVPKVLLIIPLIWSLIGFSAAMSLQVKQDFGLVMAGISTVILLFIRDRADRRGRSGS